MRIFWSVAGATAAALAIGTIGLVFFSSHGSAGKTSPGPQMVLAGDSFDLGEVPADRTVERTVAFQNLGVAPLNVSVAKVRPAPDAACGCGVEGFEVRPETVPPKGEGQIVFKLRVPEGMAEMEDLMVAELRTNDPARADFTISLRFRMSNQAGGIP